MDIDRIEKLLNSIIIDVTVDDSICSERISNKVKTSAQEALVFLANHTPRQVDNRGADRLAIEVARLIDSKIIDSRSPAADALLDYKDGKFYGSAALAQPAAPQRERSCRKCRFDIGNRGGLDCQWGASCHDGSRFEPRQPDSKEGRD